MVKVLAPLRTTAPVPICLIWPPELEIGALMTRLSGDKPETLMTGALLEKTVFHQIVFSEIDLTRLPLKGLSMTKCLFTKAALGAEGVI